MKKKFAYLLLLATLPLTGCGTENYTPQEAVEKKLPELVKTTVDTYGESECFTANVKVTNLQIDATYGDMTINAPISGEAVVGIRNMYTTDITQLQAGIVLKNCNISLNISKPEEEPSKYELKEFNAGVYLSSGNIYVDFSSSFDKVINLIPEEGLFGGLVTRDLVKTFLGGGKLKFEDIVDESKLPLVKKEELSEEKIATKIKDIFGVFNDEDLAKVMSLTHDRGNNTYDLKFTVTDPEIVNRTYDNTESQYKGKCEAVNLSFEALTNDKGAFNSAKVKGDATIKTDELESSTTVKVTVDAEGSCNFDEYTIKNPSFKDFKSAGALLQILEALIGGLIPSGE